MDDLMLKLRVLMKAETAIRTTRLRLAVRQAGLYGVGLVLALLALGLLNLAIYQWLQPHLGNPGSAFALTVVNGIVALILMLAANRAQPGPELEMAEEIRDMALTELASDAESVKQDLNKMKTDVSRISDGFRKLLGGDLSMLGLPNLSPLLGVLLSSVKKKSS